MHCQAGLSADIQHRLPAAIILARNLLHTSTHSGASNVLLHSCPRFYANQAYLGMPAQQFGSTVQLHLCAVVYPVCLVVCWCFSCQNHYVKWEVSLFSDRQASMTRRPHELISAQIITHTFPNCSALSHYKALYLGE